MTSTTTATTTTTTTTTTTATATTTPQYLNYNHYNLGEHYIRHHDVDQHVTRAASTETVARSAGSSGSTVGNTVPLVQE